MADVIAFISIKGGVGKTMVALETAFFFGESFLEREFY